MPPCRHRICGAARWSNSMTANVDMHQVATLFCGGAAVPGFPIAGIICGWRDATVVCRNPIAVHIGLAEVPVGLPRVCCRLVEVKNPR